MLSRIFDILQGELKKVLGCFKHILEVTESRSPKLMMERDGGPLAATGIMKK